jgi:hypothetical protein
MTTEEIKTIKKKSTLKDMLTSGGSLSFIKIATVALTAVSMAIVSSKLTSVVNSLVLAVLVSVGTAVFGEIYRIILSITAAGTKKMVAPIVEKLDEVTPQTEEIKVLKEQVAELDKEESPYKGLTLRKAIVRYFERNKYMRTALLFTFIAIITVSISYTISNSTDKQELVSNYNTTVQQTSISDDEKNKLIQDAVNQANQNSQSEESADSEKTSEISQALKTLQDSNKDLQSKLDQLQTDKESDEQKITDLEAKLSELEKTVKTLQTPTPSPSPTTNTPTNTNTPVNKN